MAFKGTALRGGKQRITPGKPVGPKPMGGGRQDSQGLSTAKVTLPRRGPGIGKPKPVQPSPRGYGMVKDYSPQSGVSDRNRKATATPFNKVAEPRRPGNATPKGRGASSQLLSKVNSTPKIAGPASAKTTNYRPQLDKMGVGPKGGKMSYYSDGQYKMGHFSKYEIDRSNAEYVRAGGSAKYPYSSRYKSQFELNGSNKRRGGK